MQQVDEMPQPTTVSAAVMQVEEVAKPQKKVLNAPNTPQTTNKSKGEGLINSVMFVYDAALKEG